LFCGESWVGWYGWEFWSLIFSPRSSILRFVSWFISIALLFEICFGDDGKGGLDGSRDGEFLRSFSGWSLSRWVVDWTILFRFLFLNLRIPRLQIFGVRQTFH